MTPLPTTREELVAAIRRDGLPAVWETVHRAEADNGDDLALTIICADAAWLDQHTTGDLLHLARARFRQQHPEITPWPRVYLIDEPCIGGRRCLDGPIQQLLVAEAVQDSPASMPGWVPGTEDHRPKRRPNAGMAEDTHHPTTPSAPPPDDTVTKALRTFAGVPGATVEDLKLIRHMLTDDIRCTTSGRP